jgi:aryl-alcohol dehydrogenase-like predicted oxidoreductase
MSLAQRRIGQLPTSALGFGCMGMSSRYLPPSGIRDDDESIRVIQLAVDLGVTLFDTADSYGPATNEQLLGRALSGRRQHVTIATKFGAQRRTDGSLVRMNGTPAYARQACDASLRRLGVDHIDLYYLHRVDPQVPVIETWSAMAQLVTAGKVGHLGVCEVTPATLRAIHAVHPVTALQTEYSLWSREPEAELLPACRDLAIGFVAYSPLGRGFLAGRTRRLDDLASGDYRRTNPRFANGNLDRNLPLVDRLAALAVELNITPAQLALAWLLHRGECIVPIPGTRRSNYLRENLASVDVTLTSQDVAHIDAAVSRGAAGARYGDEEMAYVGC